MKLCLQVYYLNDGYYTQTYSAGQVQRFPITKKLLKYSFVDLVSQENRQSHLMQAHPRAQVVIHLVYTEMVNQTMTASNRQIQKRQQTNQ